MDYISGRKTHNLLFPVRIKLMEIPVRIRLMEIPSTISSQQQSDVVSCWTSPNERFSHLNSNDPIVVAECGETTPSTVAQQFCLMLNS